MVKDRLRYKDPAIEYWFDLKFSFRKRHIASYYYKELMDKLQRLQQKSMNVEEYRQKMELFMIRVGIEEKEAITIARFLSGLNIHIRDKVELLSYHDLNDLVQLCIKVEQQLLRKTSFKRDSTSSNSYVKVHGGHDNFVRKTMTT